MSIIVYPTSGGSEISPMSADAGPKAAHWALTKSRPEFLADLRRIIEGFGAMSRSRTEHVLRAAAAIKGAQNFVIVGSTAVLVQFPDASGVLSRFCRK